MVKGSVKKCRFYYSGKVSSEDQEPAIEKVTCYPQFLEGWRDHGHHGVPHGKTPGSVRRWEQWKENMGTSPYCGF